MNPKLSIIVPVYRAENTLEKCLDSLLAQPYRDMEIVLVEDASPDASGKLCDAYAQKYDCIKVLHKEHGGPTHTRKAGLAAASGEYMSFVASDD